MRHKFGISSTITVLYPLYLTVAGVEDDDDDDDDEEEAPSPVSFLGDVLGT